MKKLLLAAVPALLLVPALTGTAVAQTQQQQYGTEVCVNASLADEAKRLFPKASLHVIPDSVDPEMNGFRIVSGLVGADGRIMTDSDEIRRRQRERYFRAPGE